MQHHARYAAGARLAMQQCLDRDLAGPYSPKPVRNSSSVTGTREAAP